MAAHAADLASMTTTQRLDAGGAVADRSFDDAFWPLFVLAFKAAFRILRETAAAEDVAADVLGRLHVRWGRLGQASHRDAWVVRSATNGALDVVRRGVPAVHRPPQPTGFEEELASRLLLASALDALSRRQREVLALLYLVGLSEDDTARVLGIGGGSVRRHAARGLERLRKGLQP